MLLPLLWYGPSGFFNLLINYKNLMGSSHSFFSSDRLYQSLPSMISRLSDFFKIEHSIIKISLLLISLLLLCILFLYAFFKNQASQEKISSWKLFSMALIFYPLVNPVGWKHFYVFLVPGFIIFTHELLDKKTLLYKIKGIGILIFFYFFLNVFTNQIFIGKTLASYKDLFSAHVLTGLLVYFALFISLLRKSPPFSLPLATSDNSQ